MVWPGGAFEQAVRRGAPNGEASPAVPLTALQIEGWQLLRAEWAADGDAQTAWRAWEAARAAAQPEAAALAASFLAGHLDASALRETFDRRTRTTWDALGLRGPAGAMFLNRLVKRARALAGGDAALDGALRAALHVPSDPAGAHAQLAAFATQLRADGLAAQPALAAAFATAWWSLQEPLAWPAFRASTRRALETEEAVFVASGDPAGDYGAFRTAVHALSGALALHPWAFEHLCQWHLRRGPEGANRTDDAHAAGWETASAVVRRGARAGVPALGVPALGVPALGGPALQRPAVADPTTGTPPGRYRTRRPLAPARGRVAETPLDEPFGPAPRTTPSHTHVQWLLARLGRQLGCRVWVAANDHARAWRGERLGTLSVDHLPPLGLDHDSQRVVALIDVVWLRGTSQVAAAFEVERTTSVHAGLLRMADLAALAPNLAVPLYVVAPEVRLDKVRRELRRPALRALGLDQRCGFFSAEALLAAAPDIARWASGPRAIDRLAERVGDR